MNDCTICEDQYLKVLDNRGIFKNDKNTTSSASTSTSTNSTANSKSKNNASNENESIWICNRCNKASQSTIDTGLPGLPKSIVKQCYSKNNFNGNIYYPTPEFGAGWCQAKRRNKLALKENYLSPLGYELNSKEEAILHLEFEKTVHENLLLNRENEYKEYRFVLQ